MPIADVIKGKHLLLCINGPIHRGTVKMASFCKSDLLGSFGLEQNNTHRKRWKRLIWKPTGGSAFC